MRRNSLKIFLFLLMIAVVTTFSYPLDVHADVVDELLIPKPTDITKLLTDECLAPFSCFAGIIIKKQLKLCLQTISSIPFVIPNPAAPAFHYYEVFQTWPPMLHGLYYVYSVVPQFKGETKLRDRREKLVYVLGKYIPALHLLYRESCTFNKSNLPLKTSIGTPISGTIRIWGTGCKPGEVVLFDLAKCKKVKK